MFYHTIQEIGGTYLVGGNGRTVIRKRQTFSPMPVVPAGHFHNGHSRFHRGAISGTKILWVVAKRISKHACLRGGVEDGRIRVLTKNVVPVGLLQWIAYGDGTDHVVQRPLHSTLIRGLSMDRAIDLALVMSLQ